MLKLILLLYITLDQVEEMARHIFQQLLLFFPVFLLLLPSSPVFLLLFLLLLLSYAYSLFLFVVETLPQKICAAIRVLPILLVLLLCLHLLLLMAHRAPQSAQF